eukprot:2560232-Rhodomonas_salina.1
MIRLGTEGGTGHGTVLVRSAGVYRLHMWIAMAVTDSERFVTAQRIRIALAVADSECFET